MSAINPNRGLKQSMIGTCLKPFQRIWHPSQKIQETADGGLELTMQVSSLHEIEPWVLSWGERVRVLGPAELKKRVAGRLKVALQLNA